MKIQLGPSDILFPVPAALVVSGSFEKPNIITIAWVGIMSSLPPVVGVSLKKSRYSLGLIRDTKEFTVNIPSADKFKETDYCGIVSGRKRDKFIDTNFTPLKSTKIDAPIIKECPFNMECVVIKEVELGEWVLFLGEIVETYIDENKTNIPNKNKIDIAKVNPLVYCATVREYWSLGNKLGNGFHAGKEILRKLDENSSRVSE